MQLLGGPSPLSQQVQAGQHRVEFPPQDPACYQAYFTSDPGGVAWTGTLCTEHGEQGD